MSNLIWIQNTASYYYTHKRSECEKETVLCGDFYKYFDSFSWYTTYIIYYINIFLFYYNKDQSNFYGIVNIVNIFEKAVSLWKMVGKFGEW